jgi:hypothetical protein
MWFAMPTEVTAFVRVMMPATMPIMVSVMAPITVIPFVIPASLRRA